MKIKINMDNVYATCENIPQNLADFIAKTLSFEIGGFGSPIETKEVFNRYTHFTFTGLVPHVVKILHKFNLPYEIIDKRIKPEKNTHYNLIDTYKARDYQKDIINRATSREIIQAATGAGKTFIMYSLIKKFSVKPVVVIAPKVSLAEQIKEEFEKFSGQEVGIFGGGYQSIKDITICTPMSAPKELLENAKAIFYDEAHNLAANNIFNTAKMAKNAYYRIGVSATPWRDGNDDLLVEAALSMRKPHLSINASKLISIGSLVPCNIFFVPFNEEFQWPGNYHKLYQEAIVLNKKRNKMISSLATKASFENNRTTLILIKNIKHGDILLQELKQKNNYLTTQINVDGQIVNVSNIEFLSGRDSKERRSAVIQSIKAGFTKILIGSTIADEGLDLPRLDCLILAGSGKSSTRAFQRVGRVLRLFKDKKNAIVFDIMDETPTFKRHALIRKALYETEPLWKIKILNKK